MLLEVIALNSCVHHERTKTKFSSAVKILSHVAENTAVSSGQSLYRDEFQHLLPKPQLLTLHLATA